MDGYITLNIDNCLSIIVIGVIKIKHLRTFEHATFLALATKWHYSQDIDVFDRENAALLSTAVKSPTITRNLLSGRDLNWPHFPLSPFYSVQRVLHVPFTFCLVNDVHFYFVAQRGPRSYSIGTYYFSTAFFLNPL